MTSQHGGGLNPKKLWEKHRDALVKRLTDDKTYNGPLPITLHSLPLEFIPAQQKYTEWVTEHYIKGNIARFEDLGSRVMPALDSYSKLLNMKVLNRGVAGQPWTDESDLNNYCGLTGCVTKRGKKIGLEDLIEKYPLVSEQNSATSPDGLIYDGETIRIYNPKTEAEAKYYGRGSRWCTAAKKDNMFARYNADGPLFIVVPKRPRYKGEKYQLHVQTAQYMNEKDEEVPLFCLLDRYKEIEPALNEQFKRYGMDIDLGDDAVRYRNMALLVSSWGGPKIIIEMRDDASFRYLIYQKGITYFGPWDTTQMGPFSETSDPVESEMGFEATNQMLAELVLDNLGDIGKKALYFYHEDGEYNETLIDPADIEYGFPSRIVEWLADMGYEQEAMAWVRDNDLNTPAFQEYIKWFQ